MTYEFETEKAFSLTLELPTAVKILTTLFENGPMSKTELILRCCLSDRAYTTYTNWLSFMGFIQIISYDDGYLLTMITNKGRKTALNGNKVALN